MPVNQQKPKINIFLSYALEDKAEMQIVKGRLSQKPNLRIFTTDMISAGEFWKSELRQAISQCDVFVVLLSPKSVSSKWVQVELGAAWGLCKPIIPIVTHRDLIGSIPLEMQDIQYLNLEELDDYSTLESIFERFENAAPSQV